ncbi:MAG: hypothetical protein KY433_11240, partial [Actinobacteria bacterium]|nr:hypothetical protein [Actinomycetota bacterium]
MDPRQERRSTAIRARLRAEDGQIMPVLMVTLIALVLVGTLLFQVARGSDQRARAQTAADAAALAGAREIRSQLEALAMSGSLDISALDLGRVRAAADEYARRNGARVTKLERLGVDVRVEVATEDELGDPAAPVDSQDVKGTAKARASFSVVSSVGEVPSGGGDLGTQPTGGNGRISEADWDELEKQLEGMGRPDNIIALGRFLQRHGFRVGENAAFGSVGKHAAGGFHYQYGNRGAIDVNFGCGCGDLYGPEVNAIEPIVPKIRELGFNTLWNIAPGDHQDHLHVDVGTPGPLGGPANGLFGGSDDVLVELRLVPLNGPPSQAPFGFGGPLQNIDPESIRASQREIARKIYETGKRLGVSDKLMLAAFETAWVESKFTNVAPGQGDAAPDEEAAADFDAIRRLLAGQLQSLLAEVRAAHESLAGLSDRELGALIGGGACAVRP